MTYYTRQVLFFNVQAQVLHVIREFDVAQNIAAVQSMPQKGEVGEKEEGMQEKTRNNCWLTRICKFPMLQEEMFRPWRKQDLFTFCNTPVQHVCECVYILTYQDGQCTWFNFSNFYAKGPQHFLKVCSRQHFSLIKLTPV